MTSAVFSGLDVALLHCCVWVTPHCNRIYGKSPKALRPGNFETLNSREKFTGREFWQQPRIYTSAVCKHPPLAKMLTMGGLLWILQWPLVTLEQKVISTQETIDVLISGGGQSVPSPMVGVWSPTFTTRLKRLLYYTWISDHQTPPPSLFPTGEEFQLGGVGRRRVSIWHVGNEDRG